MGIKEDSDLFLIDEKRLINTTSDLVKIESINPPGLEEEVGKYLMNFFQEASIEAWTIPVEGSRFDVVARIPGKDSTSSLAFTGHMDVVPVSEKERLRWKTPPFSGEIQGEFIRGRGSADMKGGLASAMVAMREIVKRGIIPQNDIYLIATVDEEDGMKGSKALLKEPFLDSVSLMVVCEPTSLKACIAGKGRTYGNIRITGKTGHGSQGKGHNAIDFMRKLLNRMEETRFPEYQGTPYGDSFLQCLAIHAGVEPCVVPDELELRVDARLVPEHKTESVWKKMEEILEELKGENAGYEAAIEIIDQREGWTMKEDSPKILQLRDVFEELKIPFQTDYFAGTTDGSIFRKKSKDCIIVGPGDLSCVHQENEKVAIRELIDSCKIYFEMMRRF
ncbi:MAG: M20 family metallopeptidase [Clostridiaceae bacterium]